MAAVAVLVGAKLGTEMLCAKETVTLDKGVCHNSSIIDRSTVQQCMDVDATVSSQSEATVPAKLGTEMPFAKEPVTLDKSVWHNSSIFECGQ